MRIILVRHGERLKQRGRSDKEAPLTENGKHEARQLKIAFDRLGIVPDAYLTSTYLHTRETGSLLAERHDPSAVAKVYSLETLTPPVNPPGNIDEIDTEADTKGLSFSTLKEVALVGHEPYLSQLVERLTSARCRPIARAEAICLEANSFRDFLQGKGKIEFRYPIHDYQEEQLRPKIQSKMSVSTFLGGFTFIVLFALVTSPIQLSTLQTIAAICMTFSLALFVAAIYIYDRLSMPEGFWAYGDRVKVRFIHGPRFEDNRRYHGDLYAFMVWTWNNVFSPAVVFGLASFVTLLLDTRNVLLLTFGLAAIVIVLVYYWITRPMLGVD